eukprot:TRINITY_DN67999_c0_g1_i7.p3 TRINITY_DN67999_c0_g1~~TRINITY_DN67999_c0_g1_i7.p3  ORF type:complete len:134 (+),score=12.13 TRINITY_DN67999_c0_g1_i7:956-1357(+)
MQNTCSLSSEKLSVLRSVDKLLDHPRFLSTPTDHDIVDDVDNDELGGNAMQSVLRCYTWRGMYEDITKYCKSEHNLDDLRHAVLQKVEINTSCNTNKIFITTVTIIRHVIHHTSKVQDLENELSSSVTITCHT